MSVLDDSRCPVHDAREAAELAKQLPVAGEDVLDPDDPELAAVLDEALETLDRVSRTRPTGLQIEEYGEVLSVGHGVARASGLPGVRSEEIVRFPNNLLGMAFNLDPEEVGIILLDEGPGLAAGALVQRTYRVLDVPVGEALLGRVVDPVGRPLDNAGPVRAAWAISDTGERSVEVNCSVIWLATNESTTPVRTAQNTFRSWT